MCPRMVGCVGEEGGTQVRQSVWRWPGRVQPKTGAESRRPSLGEERAIGLAQLRPRPSRMADLRGAVLGAQREQWEVVSKAPHTETPSSLAGEPWHPCRWPPPAPPSLLPCAISLAPEAASWCPVALPAPELVTGVQFPGEVTSLVPQSLGWGAAKGGRVPRGGAHQEGSPSGAQVAEQFLASQDPSPGAVRVRFPACSKSRGPDS